MEDLKQCPFCGCDAVISEKRSSLGWIVECSNVSCPASYMIGAYYETKEEAIEAWNRRVKDEFTL